MDPDIKNLNIKSLFLCKIKFEEQIENVFNEKMSIITFRYSEFCEGFDFVKMFNQKSKEEVKNIQFISTNIPSIDKISKNTFNKFLFAN